MRTSNFLEGKGSVAFVSPEFEYVNISCIQFYFKMQSTMKDQWNILSITLAPYSSSGLKRGTSLSNLLFMNLFHSF